MNNVTTEAQKTIPLMIKNVQSAEVRHFVAEYDCANDNKHTHWLESLESDNFSIFIKTWFAFLATVHRLVIAYASEEERTDLALFKGDKLFLDKFKSLYSRIELNDLSKKYIWDVFQKSHQVILNDYPQYFYPTYYKKFESEDIFIKEPCCVTVNRRKMSYRLDVLLKDGALKIGVLFTDSYVYEHLHKRYEYKSLKIETLPDIHLLICQPDTFYDYIRNAICDKLIINIKDPKESSFYSKMLEKISAIIQQIDQSLKNVDLHRKIFVPWCDEKDIFDNDYKEWFFYFSYQLRNILFHRIIDPFDIRWSNIMKYCYQGLRELLLENIRLLNEFETTSKESANV